MAHLLIFRSCTSFVQHPEAINGTHELIEHNINKRKYPFTGGRQGYNIPHASEWKILEYRVKKEVIPYFLNDLNAIVLNPADNRVNILHVLLPSKWWEVFKLPAIHMGNRQFKDHSTNRATTGKMFIYVMYAFKIARRIPFLRSFIPHPVEIDKTTPKRPFAEGWSYNFCIGMLKDADRGHGEEL